MERPCGFERERGTGDQCTRNAELFTICRNLPIPRKKGVVKIPHFFTIPPAQAGRIALDESFKIGPAVHSRARSQARLRTGAAASSLPCHGAATAMHLLQRTP